MMAKVLEEDRHAEWDQLVPATIHAYNITVHTATGFSPFMLHHGRECRTWVDRLLPEVIPPVLQEPRHHEQLLYYTELMRKLKHVYDCCASRLDRQHAVYSRPRTVHDILHGFRKASYAVVERVYVHIPQIRSRFKGKQFHKFVRYWRGPYTISKKVNDVVYEVRKNGRGRPIKQHISHLKMYHENPYADLLTPV